MFALAMVAGSLGTASATACAMHGALLPAEVRSFADKGCDLTGAAVSYEGLGVHVPKPGHAVEARGMTPWGEYSLSVTVDVAGGITVDVSAPDDPAQSAATRSRVLGPNVPPPECSSSVRYQKGFGRKPPDRKLVWSYNGAGEPRSGAYLAIWIGADNMTYGVNDCALPSATFGITHLASPGSVDRGDFDSDGSCAWLYDDLNVVDWGTLPSPFVARVCEHSVVDVGCVLVGLCVTTVDVRFEPDESWFIAPELPQEVAEPMCTFPGSQTPFAGYDLTSYAAHEFGHVWGLGHTDEVASPRMTMSPEIPWCDFSARLIGRGDYVGMCERWCLNQFDTASADARTLR